MEHKNLFNLGMTGGFEFIFIHFFLFCCLLTFLVLGILRIVELKFYIYCLKKVHSLVDELVNAE